MKQVDVSFCIPVYNVSGFLEDCLESVLAESKEINAEIICVDDCSSDDSWSVLQTISSKNSRVICMRNECNKGVSYSRNRALSTAVGKYVWFVDPDDLLYPGTVKRFFDNAERENADIVVGNYVRVEESYRLSGCAENTEMVFQSADYIPHPVDSAGTTMNAIWAGLFRTEFLKENNLWFREKMIAQEDTLFYYEVEQRYPKVIKTNAVCYLYRQRQSSVMHRRSEERIEQYYFSMRIMLEVYLDYLNSEKYRDKDILTEKIHRSYENVSSCLAQCTDNAFVRKNLKEIKILGYYPYPFRKAALKQKGSRIKALLTYLLPIEPCFWVIHFIYSTVNKNRFQ